MNDIVVRLIASAVTAWLFCFSTRKLLGAMQQSGYKYGVFRRWLFRKDNLYYNRLAVFALCLGLSTAIFALCFFFLGVRAARVCSAIPFFALFFLFQWVDGQFALKVSIKKTGRVNRLFVAYLLTVWAVCFGVLTLLFYLAKWNGSDIYAAVAYVPFAIMPLLLPAILCIVNFCTGIFENARNKRFVKTAKKMLDRADMIRIGVVGSYGNTSVKNILATVLAEKYEVLATPESFNTPMGIAKTVRSLDFDGKQVLIAEMGARKRGDIAELCDMVKPDYAVFTGVCEQHILTFQTVENVWLEKSEILRCNAKKVVCGESLKDKVEDGEGVIIASKAYVQDLCMEATETSFTLVLDGERVAVKTCLLGGSAVENILLAALLCKEMGMTAAEIERGLAKVEPVPHRLQLIRSGKAYILDDGYNCNPLGAREAISALMRFQGERCIVTPGIVECGVLEEKINGELGEYIAKAAPEKVILVGETLISCVKEGYKNGGGDMSRLVCVESLDGAKLVLAEWMQEGNAVLYLNDLPDVY